MSTLQTVGYFPKRAQKNYVLLTPGDRCIIAILKGLLCGAKNTDAQWLKNTQDILAISFEAKQQ